MGVGEGKPKAVIVGGSIGGLSAAHALILAGWDVVILEKTASPPSSGTPTGAGLGLDPVSRKIVGSWLAQPQLLHNISVPLSIDQTQTPDSKKVNRVLTRDENYNSRAVQWGDLHRVMYNALPPKTFLWGHHVLSFNVADDKGSVAIQAKVVKTSEVIDIEANLLVAADGSLSSIRRQYLPEFKLRYSGYCAWRGILDFSEDENSDTMVAIRKAYPDLGNCLYFDLSPGTHTVFYELSTKKLNWIWYVTQPEPEVKGNSVTMKVSDEMIQNMHQEAEKVWSPEFAQVIKDTKDPFLNIIYDSDPLDRIFWDNVVLIGDAAHPTTPHCRRGTNMCIVDAAVLGKCLEKWGAENLESALQEYQFLRLPVTSKQVLHARRLGRIKQGLTLPDRETFDPESARPEDCEELKQRNTPFFNDVPVPLASTISLN